MARMCPDCGTGIVRKRRNMDEYACTGCGQEFKQTVLFADDEIERVEQDERKRKNVSHPEDGHSLLW